MHVHTFNNSSASETFRQAACVHFMHLSQVLYVWRLVY